MPRPPLLWTNLDSLVCYIYNNFKAWMNLLGIYNVTLLELEWVAVIVRVVPRVIVRATYLSFNHLLQINQALFAVVTDIVDPLLSNQMLVGRRNRWPIYNIVFEQLLTVCADGETRTLKRESFDHSNHILIFLQLNGKTTASLGQFQCKFNQTVSCLPVLSIFLQRFVKQVKYSIDPFILIGIFNADQVKDKPLKSLNRLKISFLDLRENLLQVNLTLLVIVVA